MSIRTYSQKIEDTRLFDLAKECSSLYSAALVFFLRTWRKKKIWLSEKSIRRCIETNFPREKVHSQTYQAAYQQLWKNIKTWREALKTYQREPWQFSGKPKMPHKRKWLQPIQFKQVAIRRKKEQLFLSLAKGQQPIPVRWNAKLPTPLFASISWKKDSGWQLHCVLELETHPYELEPSKFMAIDLGVKRIAASFDGNQCATYSGKAIRSLIRLRNKLNANVQTRLSKLQKHSRKYKKIKHAYRRISGHISNKIKDILHKTSRTIVNEAVQTKISRISIGDCAGIHIQTNCGKVNNQQIQQSPEQELRRYIQYKFEAVSGIVATVSEAYTSQTCPVCDHRHKPKGREYRCTNRSRPCGFVYDRDAVGARYSIKKTK